MKKERDKERQKKSKVKKGLEKCDGILIQNVKMIEKDREGKNY